MSPATISIRDALRFAWVTLRAHLQPLLMLGACGVGLALISQSLGRSGAGGIILSAGVQLLQVALTLLLIRVALKLHDGEPVDLSNPSPMLVGFFPYLVTSFLLGLILTVGFALLIVPGVFLALALGFAPFFAAERTHEPLEALRASRQLTRELKGPLFKFGLALLGLNLLGVLALGVGTVVTVPMSALASAWVFRRLQGRSEPVLPRPESHFTPRAV